MARNHQNIQTQLNALRDIHNNYFNVLGKTEAGKQIFIKDASWNAITTIIDFMCNIIQQLTKPVLPIDLLRRGVPAILYESHKPCVIQLDEFLKILFDQLKLKEVIEDLQGFFNRIMFKKWFMDMERLHVDMTNAKSTTVKYLNITGKCIDEAVVAMMEYCYKTQIDMFMRTIVSIGNNPISSESVEKYAKHFSNFANQMKNENQIMKNRFVHDVESTLIMKIMKLSESLENLIKFFMDRYTTIMEFKEVTKH